jgi:hypothetical protein
MRRLILTVGLLGAVLFAGAWLLSFTHPLLVEQGARELLRIEVEKRVGEKLDSLSDSRIAVFAQRTLGRTDAQIEEAKLRIREDVAGRVANIVADMLNADCSCRQRLVAGARQFEGEHLASLVQARERLDGLIESAYASVAHSLMREYRIFTGSNAIAFALLALVAFVRKGAKLQLLLPAIVLVGAVAITGGLYLFNQDWLHTIVFGDYVGWAYAACLSVAVLALGDILMNRARVCTQLVNAFLNVVGSAASAVPC